ncbi:MAG: flagellin [Bacteriovoracaceae bacterium]
MRIATNVPSISAQRSLSTTKMNLDNNLRKLSSGERITRAGDDAAGLAISEKIKSHVRGMRQAKRNAEDGISMIQTSEGALSEVSNMIIRLRELAIQAASDTVGDTERAFTDKEFQQLKDEIERISKSTEFNGSKLLDGTTGVMELQIGIHNDPWADRLRYDGTEMDSTLNALGIQEQTVINKVSAQNSLKSLDNSLVRINGMRAEMGALQNRLNSVVNTLGINDENLSAANSRIRDVDVAYETADMTKNNILVQSGVSVLSQANQSQQMALKLIG